MHPRSPEVTDLLRRAGLRPTDQRRTVLADLLDHRCAITAQQLHARLRDAGHRIGLSTVYSTLGALAEAGTLHLFPRADEIAFRRCSDDPHQHLVCVRCGHVEEAAADATAATAGGAPAAAAGFTVQHRRTDLYGICPAC